MTKKDYLVVGLVLLLLISCSSDKINPFGLEEVTNTSLGKIEHIISFGSIQEQTVDFPVSYVKNSDDLLIGKYREIESAILLKFGTITDELNAVTVKKVFLFLSPKSKIKESISQPLLVDIHAVTMSWDEETIEPLNVFSNFDPNILTSGEFPDTTTIRDSLELGTGIFQSWIDKTTNNNGILLMSPSADHIAVYNSEETADYPILKIVYEEQSQTDSSFFTATEALSVVQNNYQLPTDRLAVGSGVGMVSYFKLNYEKIPRKASINRAFLELHVDTLHSIHQDLSIYEFSQLKANSSDWLNFPELADSSSYDTTRYFGGSWFRVNLKNALQDWVNRDGDDFGFRLAPLRMGDGLFRTIIYSSTIADTLLQPKLEIYYSIPPEFSR